VDVSTAADRGGNDLVGMVIEGKYELTDLIGEGAMGWVYQGRHRSLDSTIAVKLMKPATEPDDTRDQRFEQEARAASRLNNPHIISIIDFGRTPGGVLYIVSEYLRGDTLSELIEDEGSLPLRRALKIMDQVLSAVDEAHSAGLVHRDMKPENIVITPLRSGEDFVKILDFGIAKLGEPGSRRLTMQGQLFGTPAYMSPEQIRGQEVTPRTDLYACALILYEMLAGQEPFQSESVMEVLSLQLHAEPEPLRERAPTADIPAALEAVVMQGMRKDPAARFVSASEFREQIHRAVRFQSQMVPAIDGRACEACGHPLSEGARFCPGCGSRYTPQEPDARPERGPEDSAPTPTDPPPPGPPIKSTAPATAPTSMAVGRSDAGAGGAAAWAADAATREGDRGLPEAASSPPAGHFQRTQAFPSQTHGAPLGSAAEPSPESPKPPPATSRRQASPEIYTTLQRRLAKERSVHLRLVGRGAELRQLDGLFAGPARVAEIIGPQGGGRSRLLQAAGEMAGARSLSVLSTGADPHLTRLPWYPVQRLLRQLLSLDSQAKWAQAPPSMERLQRGALDAGLEAGDVPGLAELFGIERLQGEVEHAVRRRETYAAALRLVRSPRIAAHGICLLFDDADDYDGATRAWLQDLASGAGDAPVYVVLAAEQPVMRDETSCVRVEPAPLGPEAVDHLMSEALERGADWPELVETVATSSRGLPLHVEQVIRLLAEGGTEVDLPLGDLLSVRFGRLPSDALRLLQCVCIFGAEASLAAVRSLYGEGAPLADAARLLERRGILSTADDTLRVTHPLCAANVRASMPADARRELHGRAFRYLSEIGVPAIHRAHHAAEAHLGEEALEQLRAAAHQAEQWLDDPGAAHHYQRALHLARWELLYDEDQEEVLRLSVRLADTLAFARDAHAASLVLKEALPSAGAHPDLHARLLRSRGRLSLLQGDPVGGAKQMQEAVRQAIFAGEPGLLCDLYTSLGRVLMDQGRHAEAADELEEGVAMVTGGDGPSAAQAPASFWRMLEHLSEARLAIGATPRALTAAADALQQARRTQTLLGQARSHFQLTRVLHALERDGEAEEHHQAAVSAFRRLGDRRSLAECLLERAAHQPTQQSALASQALELAEQIHWPAGVEAARAYSGSVGEDSGNHSSSLSEIRRP